MPLYDVTGKKDKWVDPKKAESAQEIQALKRSLPSNTFNRLTRTIDEEIWDLNPSESSKLIWTKAGALVGRESKGPKKWIDHLWDKVISVVGPDRLCLITVGSLIRWRISLREETWLVYRRESNVWDDVNRKYVRVSEYWINNNYDPDPDPSKKPASLDSIKQLQNKWGGTNERRT